MNSIADEILSYFGNAERTPKLEDIDISDLLLHSSTNSVASEIADYYGINEMMQDSDDEFIDDYLNHYGMPKRSGRYPYGSGENPYQHCDDFLGRVSELKKSNFTYTDEKGKTWTGDNAIAKQFGLTTTEYRRQVSWANYEKRCRDVATAKSLKADNLSNTEIGRRMGINESTVRSLLNPNSEDRMNQCMKTVDILREQVEKKGMVDVGAGAELSLGVSRVHLDTAIDYLNKAEGCPVYKGGVPQLTTAGQQSNEKVLCLPGTEHREIYEHDKVHSLDDYVSKDGGVTYQRKFTYPESLDSSRLMIRYDEDKGPDGAKGIEKDGIIELRRGVADLSLGESRYSQVRIMVDGTHYLKGMAVYSDDLPDGVDVVFNTNKKQGTPMTDVLKKVKADPDNPFGSLIKDADQGGQYWYDSKTGERCGSDDPNAKLGLINKRADQGDWSEWANAIPSQFLSKQTKPLAKKQLDLAKADKLAEYEEYCNLTNPTIKKHMLEKFADECDSAAVHLKAAALPGQRYHVIVPINSLNDNEIYAPNYTNGTKLALVRFPHGGIFEIPILTVNNRNKLGNSIIGSDSEDAVGINHKIADQLSGADFDGDTVMCIPTDDSSGKVKIRNKRPLADLEGFDPKIAYGGTKTTDENGEDHYSRNGVEYPIMKDTQKQMGVISNLITDMTLGGANDKELARAVKHSMVVIDAEKHKLDYKASEIENNIDGLKAKYQITINPDGSIKVGGASTLLSRAKGEYTVNKRQGSYKTNLPDKEWYDPTRPVGVKLWKEADDLYYPERVKDKKIEGNIKVTLEDGSKISYNPRNKEEYDQYNPVAVKDPTTNKTVGYTNPDGTIKYKTLARTQPSTNMAETDDPYTLVSNKKHAMELLYADYATSMKNLANQARVEVANAGKIEYKAEAKREYQAEVKSLNDKLDNALSNAPKQRQALRLANAEVARKKKEYKETHGEDMSNKDVKKLNQVTIAKYRQEVGASSRKERNIEITDNEWKAIQAGAVSETTLKKILNNTDIDKLRERATPRLSSSPSTTQINRMKALAASNYTLDEIAKKLGYSTSTVSKYLKGGK